MLIGFVAVGVETMRSYQSLAQADPAVARRNFTVKIDVELFFSERSQYKLKQQNIVKAAST